MESYFEIALAVLALASSVFVYFKNKNVSGAVRKIQEALKTNKTMFVVCPKCGEKITLTLENVKEEEKEKSDDND